MAEQAPKEDRYTELAALVGTAVTPVVTALLASAACTPPVLISMTVGAAALGVAYILGRSYVKGKRADRDATRPAA